MAYISDYLDRTEKALESMVTSSGKELPAPINGMDVVSHLDYIVRLLGTMVSEETYNEIVKEQHDNVGMGIEDRTRAIAMLMESGEISGSGDLPSASPKAVNFIDYDGTVLYSYSESDALALTELPDNPTHSGLTSQGWNWTLEQIKSQLAAMPGAPVWVGQMYITDDGKTRIYCHFEKGRLAPYLGLGTDGTVIVDWGDGSNPDTLTGMSLTTAVTVQHTYASAGDYVITLTAENGSFAFFGTSNVAHILKTSADTTTNVSRVYANCIQRIEIGDKANIGTYAFYYCYSLASITIPSSVTSIGSSAFYYCNSLASITIPSSVTSIDEYLLNNCNGLASIAIPSSVTSIGGNAFRYCYSLASITIPSSVTSIGRYLLSNCNSLASIAISSSVTSISNGAFNVCYSLTSITIPSSVTSINSSAFSGCQGLGEIHFLSATPPTVSSPDAFSYIQTDCIIYVPEGSLEAYTTATNYPNSNTYIYVEE